LNNRLFGFFFKFIPALLLASLLTQCVAPALLLAPQGQLMWALLKPMVGLDPKEANLFKQPLIQSRLEPLLGPHYGTAVQLLETADQIQQEGPLFYVVSKHTPVPELAEKAGFVWNSETNQMAVLLVSGGAPQIFAEKLNEQMAQQVPSWPAELTDYTDPEKLQQRALQQATAELKTQLPVPAAIAPITETVTELKDIKGQTKALLEQKKQALLTQATAPVANAQMAVEQQKQQLQDEASRALTAPADLAMTQAVQSIKPLQAQAAQAINAPVKDIVSQVKVPANGLEQNTQLSADIVADSKKPVLQQAQAVTETKTPAAATALLPDDDLAAEFATEQQTLKNDKSDKIKALQQEILTCEQQLSQATGVDDIKKLQQKLQQLRAKLKLLQSEH
jgi:hypothetical protein